LSEISGTFSNPYDEVPEIPGTFSNPYDEMPEIPGILLHGA
jgi:hypothetical protein